MRLAVVPVVVGLLVAGCGGGGGGGGGSSQPSGAAGSTGTTGSYVCSDLFDQNTVRTYSIDITPDEWNSIQAEFHDLATLTAKGNDFVSKHPVTFHMGAETAT